MTDVARAEDFSINPAAYQNLLVHIAVALLRIEEDCYAPLEPEHLERIKAKREYQVAEKIAAAISDELGVQLPDEEVGYIAIHLAGKQAVPDVSEAADGSDEGVVISDEVWAVVSEMLECVWRAFRFDFRNDLELRMNLARHIVPLSVRLRYRMRLKNPLLDDIRVRYPLAYSMAVDASSVLAQTYAAEISDDEIGYIALAFALALERQKSDAAKKNILVVCASGAGSARLLEYRCRSEFGEYIESIETCDIMHLDSYDFSNTDYVFTTVPIERSLPVPVREVTYFLDTEDVAGVRKLLSDSATLPGIPPYFRPSLFFAHLPQRTKSEVLDYLMDQVCAQENLPSTFRELVWKREGVVPTAFGNNVAMPHPLEAVSPTTFICVGLLDNPVVWDAEGSTVRAVFLLGFAPEKDGALQRFLSTFAELLMSKQAIDTIIANQTWETFADVLVSELVRQQPGDGEGGSPA